MRVIQKNSVRRSLLRSFHSSGKRTLSGKSVTGGGFPKYSSQYVNSVDF
jgi:hypothetical protein